MYKEAAALLVFILHAFVLSIPIDDPSEWPGHLEAFGSKQNIVDINNVLYEWPSPEDFFRSFVDKVKPVHLKGVYRHSMPVEKWTDEYLIKDAEASKKCTVMAEPSVIENRTSPQKRMSFHEFVGTYQKHPILTFSNMPSHLKKDVSMPRPFRCNDTSKSLVNANLVMSRGNAKSHIYNDDVETVYCSFRGTVHFLLMEYTKNKGNIIDRPQGGYSTVDVQRVDFVKYPKLRKIKEFIKVLLNPGDCLYIPYRWYKQYNSYGNDASQSIAMNIWFKHMHDHRPHCDHIPDNEATLNKYQFSDEVETEADEEAEKEYQAEKARNVKDGIQEEEIVEEVEKNSYGGERLLLHFQHYTKAYKKKNITLAHFYHIIKRDGIVNQEHVNGLKYPKSFQLLVKELFARLDVNNDKVFSKHDFELLEKEPAKVKKMEEYLEYQTARLEDYVEDLVESQHHDESIHAFDKRKTEEIRSARPFDEL